MKFVVNLSHICPTIVLHSAFFGEVCNYLYQNHESRFVNNLTESATLLSLMPHPKNVARPAGVAGKSKPLPVYKLNRTPVHIPARVVQACPPSFMIPDFSRCSTWFRSAHHLIANSMQELAKVSLPRDLGISQLKANEERSKYAQVAVPCISAVSTYCFGPSVAPIGFSATHLVLGERRSLYGWFLLLRLSRQRLLERFCPNSLVTYVLSLRA